MLDVAQYVFIKDGLRCTIDLCQIRSEPKVANTNDRVRV